MIDDIYVENFVKRERSAVNSVFTVCSIALCIVLIVFINVIPVLLGLNVIFFTGVISFGLGFLCFLINRRQHVEYETSITNDNFTVSRILGETKRELLADFELKECKRIAPVTGDNFDSDYKEASLHLNATRYKDFERTDSNWYCFVESDGVKYIVIFEFQEKMYKAFRRYNPRNTHFMRIVEKKDDEE